MAKRSGREGNWVLPVAAVFLSLTILLAVLLIVGRFVPPGGHWTILGTVTGIVWALVLAGGAATLAGLAYLLLGLFQMARLDEGAARLEQSLRRQGQLLETIAETAAVSDRAKAVAFREKEREMLRKAIQEDVAKQDWEAAYYLIDEMQRSFGYIQEAQRLRVEVDQQRDEAVRAALAADIAAFRGLLATRDWTKSRAEASALKNRYPGNAAAAGLGDEVDEARQMHKRGLLSEWKLAMDRNDLDRSIALVKELDQYLTPGEAAGLQEAARGVFRAKLQNLGVQFSLCVAEKNWAGAIKVGQEIINEFPNSRMAQEVHDSMDGLHKRAAAAIPKAAAPTTA